MSNVYIQEPPTNGKVLLKTSVGDIDIELWAKEAPKACRNFVQLCLEGYYDGTIFHRIVKGFIAQGGDPTGSGTGGDSVYGHPFKDEFHTRLRFNRRGLVAMANAGKDDNGSQFFFTLGATPELQNKHTIFGKVTGETLYNMIKLEDALVDHEDRPQYPQKITSAEVLLNPFTDIQPRTVPKREEKKDKKKKDKKVGVKNFKLLSFGEEAEEDEEEVASANEKLIGRGKSTHDVLNDPNLSAVPAVHIAKDGSDSDDDALSGDKSHTTSDESESEEDKEQVDRIKKKLKKNNVKEENTNEDEEFSFDRDRKEERKRKAESIRKEIDDLKRSYQEDKKRKREDTNTVNNKVHVSDESTVTDNTMIQNFKEEEKKCRMKSKFPKKGASRESFTLNLLDKFRKKLHAAKERAESNDTTEESSAPATSTAAAADDDDDDDDDNSEGWLTHKLQFSEATPVLARDASTKDDDWYEIHDPRSKLSQQRREISKNIMKSRDRR